MKQGIKDCTSCRIGRKGTCSNDKRVISRGSLPCDILFIGEAPGPNEIAVGYPFIGRSGQLLDKIIDESGIRQFLERIAFTNCLMCYPKQPDNDGLRKPTDKELYNCKKHLKKFIRIAK